MKERFISFINSVTHNGEDFPDDELKAYWAAFQETNSSSKDKEVITSNGLMILTYMQDNSDKNPMFKARDIAEDIQMPSRSISGSLRKLVTDGFVEKMGGSPTIYYLTEKGKNYKGE